MKNLKRMLCLLVCIVTCAAMVVPAAAYTPPAMESVWDKDTCVATSLDQYNNKVTVGMQDPLISFSESGRTYYCSSYSILGADDSITISNTGLDCDELATVIALLKKDSGSHYKWAQDSYDIKNPNTGKMLFLKNGESTTVQVSELLKYFNLNSKQMGDYLLCILMTGFNDGEEYAHLAKYTLFGINDDAVEAIKAYPFDDVDYGSYCWDSVQWALDKGVTKGISKTSFGPKETCTRGQVATFLWRALGSPEPQTTENPFKDVKETDYYYKPILWAYENGITNGTSKTEFSPNGTCTSAHVVTFLWRANGKPVATAEGTEYYAEAVAWANSKGLLEGVGATFKPENNSPRADIVTYLYRNAEGK